MCLQLLDEVLLERHAVPIVEVIVLRIGRHCGKVQRQPVPFLREEECALLEIRSHWSLYQSLHGSCCNIKEV